MIYSALFIILAAAAFWYWRKKFIPAEVAKNDSDIDANGSQDSLRAAYHARRTRIRGAWLLALSTAASAPMWVAGWLAGLLALLAVAVLLYGYFSRWFTPLLNLARSVKRPDITEYYASPDSASWPDAAVYKQIRLQRFATDAAEAAAASAALERLLVHTWYWCLAGAGLLAAGAVWVAVCTR